MFLKHFFQIEGWFALFLADDLPQGAKHESMRVLIKV